MSALRETVFGVHALAVLPVEVVLSHGTLPVKVVSAKHDALDYMAVVGGLVGGGAAIVAAALAVRSSGAAARSAKASEASTSAAEKALALAEDEAAFVRSERKRIPELSVDLQVRAVGVSNSAPPATLVLTVTCHNAGGRDADRVIVNVTVPKSVKLEAAGDADGATSGGPVPDTGVAHLPDGRLVWSSALGRTSPGSTALNLLRVPKPSAGDFRVEAKISYDEGKGSEHRLWNLHIPESGGDVRFEPVDADVPSTPPRPPQGATSASDTSPSRN